MYDFQWYRLHALMEANPSLYLRNAAGQLVNVTWAGPPCHVFDFSNPKMVTVFMDECVNATASGHVDGCFIDYAVDNWPKVEPPDKAAAYAAGHYTMLEELQRRIGEGPVSFGIPLSWVSATALN